MIEKLKDIAFRIHIEPLKTVENATKVKTVIKVLSDIYESYNNYLEIEFAKNETFRKALESNNKVFETIKEDLSLLIVDLNFGSFEAALAPDLLNQQTEMFSNEVLDWKKETFNEYKEDIIFGDYENVHYIKKVTKKYNVIEREKIFKPLFSSIGNGKEYRINLKDTHHNIVKNLIQPETSKQYYISKNQVKNIESTDYSTVQIFAKVKKLGDTLEINKKDIKEVLFSEVLEHDTYPFKPEIINYQETIFVLNKNLNCIVEFEKGIYFIKNEELDLVVWGDSRKEAEAAFSFGFYSLYLNYYLEENTCLSDEAILLKEKIISLIKKVVNED